MAIVKKKKLRPLPKLLKDAEKVFNAFIRRRDSSGDFFQCISCGKVKPVCDMNSGHYVPVKRSSFLRFSEDNCHGECEYDNCWNEFHLIGYRKNLIEKIGLQKVDWMETNYRQAKKWSRDELNEIIQKYSI